MTKNSRSLPRVREVVPADRVKKALQEMVQFLQEKFDLSKEDVALVGIQSRGAVIAQRMAQALKKEKNIELPVGALDITLYRDDFGTSGIHPVVRETHLDFEVDDKHIVLVDDVLFTGRTIRAALDEIMDFGRPKSVVLAVMVDRGNRELPIAADFAALKIPTKPDESVNLFLKETDDKDEIAIGEPLTR